MFLKILLLTALGGVAAAPPLTFRNVVVTCDAENAEDAPFGTIVTTTSLQPHLPSGQNCYKISIQHSIIPTLYADSLSDINTAFLVLEDNSIKDVEPGAFRNVKLKGGLSLSSNQIREVRRGVFNGVKVPLLILSNNFISYIDFQAFDNMTTLESVHLDHNKLSRIDSFWFRNTPKVSKVNLQYNDIREIPPNAFQNLGENSGGVSIDLSHNNIKTVNSRALTGIKKVKLLNLAFNQIHSLERYWLRGVKVGVLDLSNNKISCLSYGLAEPPASNFVDRNPLDCGCLEEITRRDGKQFGALVAEEAFRRCNI